MSLSCNEWTGGSCMKINIFTYLSGYYRSELYERFAGSLFDTGFSGNLYLFVHEADHHCLSLLPQELQDKIYFVTCPQQMNNLQDNINGASKIMSKLYILKILDTGHLSFLQQ